MRLSTFPNAFTLTLPRDLTAAVDAMTQQINGLSRIGFPAHDIVADDKGLSLSFAVAGFEEAELGIEVENGILTISGRKEEEKEEKNFVHRGIARRGFRRSFDLTDKFDVAGATLRNGILEVRLELKPEVKDVRKIEISKAA